jgi:hypothetical protein
MVPDKVVRKPIVRTSAWATRKVARSIVTAAAVMRIFVLSVLLWPFERGTILRSHHVAD